MRAVQASSNSQLAVLPAGKRRDGLPQRVVRGKGEPCQWHFSSGLPADGLPLSSESGRVGRPVSVRHNVAPPPPVVVFVRRRRGEAMRFGNAFWGLGRTGQLLMGRSSSGNRLRPWHWRGYPLRHAERHFHIFAHAHGHRPCRAARGGPTPVAHPHARRATRCRRAVADRSREVSA